jgi:hypothetical protein
MPARPRASSMSRPSGGGSGRVSISLPSQKFTGVCPLVRGVRSQCERTVP